MPSQSAPWGLERHSASPSWTTHLATPPSSAERPVSFSGLNKESLRPSGRWDKDFSQLFFLSTLLLCTTRGQPSLFFFSPKILDQQFTTPFGVLLPCLFFFFFVVPHLHWVNGLAELTKYTWSQKWDELELMGRNTQGSSYLLTIAAARQQATIVYLKCILNEL